MTRKLNVHYLMDEPSRDYCLQINAGISKITETSIRFFREQNSTPHITVVMGSLRESSRIEAVVRVVKLAAQKARRCSFGIGRPYISHLNGHYVLSDLEPDSSFAELQASLEANLLPHLDLSRTIDKSAHITLGYVTNEYDSVRGYLGTVSSDRRIVGSTLEISDVGDKGTCINSLFRTVL